MGNKYVSSKTYTNTASAVWGLHAKDTGNLVDVTLKRIVITVDGPSTYTFKVRYKNESANAYTNTGSQQTPKPQNYVFGITTVAESDMKYTSNSSNPSGSVMATKSITGKGIIEISNSELNSINGYTDPGDFIYVRKESGSNNARITVMFYFEESLSS